MRNFALARLALDKRLPFNTVPNVTDWDKFDVSQWGNVGAIETFEPMKYAQVCHRLVNEVLLPVGQPLPDALLIERQRSRSASSATVTEWVFRVNMLEAMLHSSVVARLANEKTKMEVISASPQRMGYFWKPLRGDVKGKLAKKFRMGLTEQLLTDFVNRDNSKISLGPQFGLVKDLGKYLPQVIRASKAHNVASFGADKGDDLVDALLHSLAWIRWQANRTVVRLELVSGLDDALKKADELYNLHTAEMETIYTNLNKPQRKPKVVASTKDALSYDPSATRAVADEIDSMKK